MEKVILTATQVIELRDKQYKLNSEIEEIKYSLKADSAKAKADKDNYGDNNFDNQMKLASLVREKAEIDDLLSDYELAEPKNNEVDYGSMVSYLILKATNPKLIGKEFNIMIVQKNYADARPEGYRYVSKDTNAGCAFYGAKVSSIVTYAADNGNQFETLVTEVNNDFCMQHMPSKQKTK